MRCFFRNIIISLIVILSFQVRASDDCNANFIFAGISENSISFANTSVYQAGEEVFYFWDFGDGNVSEQKNPLHTYQDPGNYRVTLSILTGSNCYNKITKSVNVGIEAQSAQCELYIYFETVNAGPPNYNNGQATVFGNGDYPGYYYPVWSNGSSYASIHNLEPGIYCVTITRDFCYGSDCVRITDNDYCQANFESEFRTFYETAAYYQFVNTSQGEIHSYYWDFGDGNVSDLASPVHYFEEEGTYEICLDIITYSGCADSYCETIQVENSDYYYGDIYGSVYVGDNPLPDGVAVLFQVNENQYSAIDYTSVIEGGYVFENLIRVEKYLTYIIPFFDVQEPYFPKYFPTYTFSKSFWQSNELIDLFEGNQYETNLTSYGEHYYGNCKISGRIDSQEANYKDYDNDDISGLAVMLLNEEREIINYTLSDENGLFEIKNLEYGNYYLRAEKAGFESEEMFFVLSENNPIINDILFVISEMDIVLKIKDIEAFNLSIDVFPNPAKDNFVVLNNTDSNLEIRFFSKCGKLIFSHNADQVSNVIDISGLPKGVYFLEIAGENQIVNKKLIKL